MVVIHAILTIGTASGSTARPLVHSRDDGVADGLDLLELLLEVLLLGRLVVVQPLKGLLESLLHLLLLLALQLVCQLVLVTDLVLHVVHIRLQRVAGVDLLLQLLVLLRKLLSLPYHAVDLLLAQAALLIRDRDLLRLASALVLSPNIQDTVGIHLEGNLDLGSAPVCSSIAAAHQTLGCKIHSVKQL
jgi:hypothetical protein